MRPAHSILFLIATLAISSISMGQEKGKVDLQALGAKLKAAVQSGEMTEDEALAKYKAAVAKAEDGTREGAKGRPGNDKGKGASLLDIAARLKAAVESGKLTQEQANAKFRDAMKRADGSDSKRGAKGKTKSAPVDLQALGRQLKAAVAAGEMTAKEATASYQAVVARQGGGEKMAGKKGKKGRSRKGMNRTTFYAIFIGRLQSKDIELGEFEFTVDHITSIYGDRSRKAALIGKTFKVTGVSGPLLDKLLLIKKGETLKLRSMTLKANVITLSAKATVLERAAPFSKDTYPIPPESFVGFRGVVTGKVVSKADQGYELILKVGKVGAAFAKSGAKEPKSIEGRLLELRGFYDQKYRATFDDLQIGDTVRLGCEHVDRTMDSLQVTATLEKVEAK